ncbi:MAG TPA: flagellin [Shinella sp.]|jgi:flagellin|uniref:flagellin N-terminal helical domain-containing protein n=1 Tax=Shinella sp. TaxID=1870904 RepID=UPI002E143C9F|nr:flagellin [Shinella sp.]
MTSILTNMAAMSALQTLRGIGSSLADTSQQVSSGLRVKTAGDNAAYWSISTTMHSEKLAMSAVTDSIGLASGIVDTAYAAMENVHKSFVEIRNLAIIVSDMPQPGFKNLVIGGFSLDEEYGKSDVAKIEQQMQQLQDQARDAMMSASFSGVNLLYNPKGQPDRASERTYSFVIGYGEARVQTLDVKAMDLLLLNDDAGYPMSHPSDHNPERSLFDLSDMIDTPGSFVPASATWYNILLTNPMTGDPEAYDVHPSYTLMRLENNIARNGGDRAGLYSNFIDYLDTKLQGLTDRMAYLGTLQNSLDTHDELNKKRIETVTKGIGRLVDADMNEASTRLKALQTQQQLAMQALQIANSEPEAILRLFN